MIKIGVCTAIDNIEKAARLGFEYIETNLSQLAALSDEDFEAAAARVDAAPIGVEACNVMLPGSIKVAGEGVNAQDIHNYLDKAFPRAKRLGCQVVVFGSGRSRSVPDGYDSGMAWRQIANFLRLLERHAQENDITVVIEPLRAAESTQMNFVSEATLMASLLQMPHIAVLGDTYHMAMGFEPLSALTKAGSLLKHIHVANAIGRRYPKAGDGEDYDKLFRVLTQMGYEGRVSVEAGCDDFEADGRLAYQVLDEARRRNLIGE